jgi:hypothetical protein
MVKRFLYDNRLPFSTGLDINLQDLKARVELNKASLIINAGGVGEGKTTLSVHEADYINKLYGLPPIDINGCQLAQGGTNFLQKLRQCYEKKLPCIVYDEAGDFSRRGSLTQFNAMLNRTFETFRAFRCIVILALPNFMVLDNLLFDNEIPRLLLLCNNRTMNMGNYAGYSLEGMTWIKKYFMRYKDKKFAIKCVDPNFYGHFLDLPPERSRELDIVSTKNKLSTLRKAEIKIDGLLSAVDLANKLNKTPKWVKVNLLKVKINPIKIIDKTKYFDENALNRLVDLLEGV